MHIHTYVCRYAYVKSMFTYKDIYIHTHVHTYILIRQSG